MVIGALQQRGRERARDALRRADRTAERAQRCEALALNGPARLRELHLELAARLRRGEEMHRAAMRMHLAFVDRLQLLADSAGRPERVHAFVAAVADTVDLSSVGLTLFSKTPDEVAVRVGTDDTAGSALDFEFVLGEGPVRSVLRSGDLVAVSGEGLRTTWPQYGPALATLGVKAVTAAPLQLGGTTFGALAGFGSDPPDPSSLASAAGALVESMFLDMLLHDEGAAPDPSERSSDPITILHNAAGVVAASSGCDVASAMSIIRARAFVEGETSQAIAAKVLRGELDLRH